MDNMVFALLFEYSDGSGSGVVRVYEDELRAQEDLDLLKTDGDGCTSYKIEPIQFFKNGCSNEKS